MPHWIEECDNHHLTSEIPRILVGNKCDMKDKIAVNTNMAQKFADNHSMPLFETSAKDDSEADHVEAIFMTLAHKLKNSKPMMPPHVGYQYIDAENKVISVGQTLVRKPQGEDKEDICAC